MAASRERSVGRDLTVPLPLPVHPDRKGQGATAVVPFMTRGRVRVEAGAKRVRVMFGGSVIADSTDVKLVWEIPYYPAYYVPEADVVDGVLQAIDRTERSPSRGDARYFDVVVGDARAEGGAWHHPESPIEEIRDHVRFDWAAMDAWFEEDEEVSVHPRDPYTRVDVLASSRHVQVEVDGEIVADSRHPVLLFETGLPTRFYLPKTEVRMDLLRPSATLTQCPYKGTAEYYDVTVGGETHEDLVWWYRSPLAESAGIEGRVCFYNERVDLVVDGERQERPRTKFS
jgi:uncharacterized protein (DUF427 family)